MKININGVILSYPHLYAMHHFENEGLEKADYKANFIFPPNFDFSQFQQAAQVAAAEKWPQQVSNAAFMQSLEQPFKVVTDGPYAGWYTATARCRQSRPTVVDPWNRFILMPGEQLPMGAAPEKRSDWLPDMVTPGSLVNAQINVFGYTHSGKNGISVTLNMLQVAELAGSREDLPALSMGKDDPDEVFAPVAGAPAPQQPVAAPAAPMGAPVGNPAVPAAPAAPVGAPVGNPAAPAAPAAPMGAPVGNPAVPAAPAAPAAPAVPGVNLFG